MLHLITSIRSFLLCKVTYSEGLGFKRWTSLKHRYSASPIAFPLFLDKGIIFKTVYNSIYSLHCPKNYLKRKKLTHCQQFYYTIQYKLITKNKTDPHRISFLLDTFIIQESVMFKYHCKNIYFYHSRKLVRSFFLLHLVDNQKESQNDKNYLQYLQPT